MTNPARILYLALCLLHWAESTNIELKCPLLDDTTWDWIRMGSLTFNKKTGNVATFCIFCQDYYANSQKDNSQSICADIYLTDKQLFTLTKITPGDEQKLNDVYIVRCEGETIKSHLTMDQIAQSDWCYKYISRGNYQITLESSENIQEIVYNATGSYFKPDWQKVAVKWRVLWGLSFFINLILSIMITTIIASHFYKRLQKDLWYTTMSGPKALIDNIKSRARGAMTRLKGYNNGNPPGDYMAHDIDFRSTVRLSTINDKQILEPNIVNASAETFTIDSIDIINYTQPKDVMLCD